jgi:hypothetical protein
MSGFMVTLRGKSPTAAGPVNITDFSRVAMSFMTMAVTVQPQEKATM